MAQLRAALLQLRTPASHEAALAHALPLLEQAAAQGAQLVVTPEATNILQRRRDALFAALLSPKEDPVAQGLRQAAERLGVWLLIGSALIKRPDGRAANRAFLISPQGEIVATYDKLHMFDVDLPTGERHRESEAYVAGEQAVVAPTPWGALGLSICYDVRFPQLYRTLAKAGADLIAVPAAFTVPTGEAHWELLLRARAVETSAFILAAAQGGLHEDGRATWGRSMIVHPWGRVLAQAADDEPQVVIADLDLGEPARVRAAIPALLHDRAFVPPTGVAA